MSMNPAANEDRLTTIVKGWEEHAPDAAFSEMTLAQFKNRVKPSLDAREVIENLESQLKAARIARDNADLDVNETVLNVVSSVRGDPGYGENSALYASFGYVRKNDRKSGLTRIQQPSAAPAPAELKVA